MIRLYMLILLEDLLGGLELFKKVENVGVDGLKFNGVVCLDVCFRLELFLMKINGVNVILL